MRVNPVNVEHILNWMSLQNSKLGLNLGVKCEILQGTGIRIGEEDKEDTVVAHFGDYIVKCGPHFYVWKKEKFEAAFYPV